MGLTPHSLLGLAVLLSVLISGPSLIEARCGYPELPYKSQLLPAAHYDNWAYFEEGQRVKVICENGLVGQAPNQTATNASTTVSDQPINLMAVDSTVWIECRNARWNTSRLQCLQKVELDSRNVQVKFKRAEAWRNLEPLVDHDALSCLELDLDKAQGTESTEESVVLSLRLETPRARIPRVVLMLKTPDNGQRPAGHPNITLLEDLIEESNTAVANGAEPEGDLEAEEAKRFLDFVYQNEFVNHSGPVRMTLMEDDASDHKHKVIRTDRHEVRVSVALDSGHECYFNEDAAISRNHSTTELLIFDCHLIEEDSSGADKSADAAASSSSLVWVRLDIRKLNDRVAADANVSRVANAETPSHSSLQLCGLEAFRVADGGCGRPYVPVYGVMSKIANSTVAQYSCQPGYRAINLTTEHDDQWANAQSGSLAGRLGLAAPMRRQCNPVTGRWSPSVEDIFCVPLASCRHPPPLPDPKKFYIEYSKLDNLKRAVAGVSTAALRCQQLTDYVLPYTAYGCDQSGQWVRLGKGNQTEPVCRPSLTRTPGRARGRGHYYHHYYHYYDQPPTNRTSIIIFGRQINDNKNLIYFGAAGLVVLFGGSFIILFHVRRMAKKISRQMRERSYMAQEKGMSESFLPVAGGGVGDGQLPPYYNNEGNFYDVNTLFSNDLPPPTTPISMPSSGLEKGQKDRNNLSAGFDSIKF